MERKRAEERWKDGLPSTGGGEQWDEDWLDAEAEAELRDALGVDDVSGFHVEAFDEWDDHDDALFPPPVEREPGSVADGTSTGAVRAGGREPFPCLDGVRYSGCLGLACPLETCWTGGMTVSFAHKMRRRTRVSATLYLPGAPCHTCACLHEETAPAPYEASAPAAQQRITCARGLWAHPISLSAFVTRRIPMLDQEEPERCPGYVPRPQPHPAVVAHLRQRRERARRQREERRATGDDRG